MPQMDEQDARDMLIRIDTKVGLLCESFGKHCEEETADRRIMDSSIKAAHRRLDTFLVSGILTIILVIAGFVFKFTQR